MTSQTLHTNPPPDFLLEPIIRNALTEDFGRAGDLTSDLLLDAKQTAKAVIAARQDGVLSGLVAAALAFRIVDPAVKVIVRSADGSAIEHGSTIAELEGPACAILSAERVALNFVGHLSGVASATHALVSRVKGTKARIVCTRKTIPGLRILQKYAVRCGGGFNHRFGMDDAILVKDNHIAAAGGLEPVISRLKERLGHMIKVEVEVDTLDQLETALRLGVDTILLDNMSPEQLRRGVAMTNGRAILEASGGISLESVREVAESGVDYISSGAITHSAVNLDLGLDFE
nr:MAG: carboxylating nicotinate-nucleotide diphosphorylase [Hyphomicrobiales bacterium]